MEPGRKQESHVRANTLSLYVIGSVVPGNKEPPGKFKEQLPQKDSKMFREEVNLLLLCWMGIGY